MQGEWKDRGSVRVGRVLVKNEAGLAEALRRPRKDEGEPIPCPRGSPSESFPPARRAARSGSPPSHRHATLWFAGEARNWPLADYFLHELEELVEEIEALHPMYRDVPVAELLRTATLPAMEALEEAVEDEDHAAFEAAYDRLTTACNACHIASDRGAIVMVRPTSPPMTNLRYLPGREP